MAVDKLTLQELRNLKDNTRSFENLSEAPFEIIYEWLAEIHAVINRLPISKKHKQELRASAADIVTIRLESLKELCGEIHDILDKEIDSSPVAIDPPELEPFRDYTMYVAPPLSITQRFLNFITRSKQ